MSNEPITINDGATPYLEFIAKTKPDWMRKAMKSMGFMMSKAIKEGTNPERQAVRNTPVSCHRL